MEITSRDLTHIFSLKAILHVALLSRIFLIAAHLATSGEKKPASKAFDLWHCQEYCKFDMLLGHPTAALRRFQERRLDDDSQSWNAGQ
jgi:hypothetical protein